MERLNLILELFFDFELSKFSGKKFILSINLNYSLNFFWIKFVIFSSVKLK